MIEIVIKIPEAAYKILKSDKGIDWLGAEHILNAVANGTPLPKGHGRLIDADALKEEWKEGFHKKIVDALMDDAPTIIEADGGNEDESNN